MTRSHPTTRPAHTRPRAFTLIEVMLAVVILGLGVLGLAALFAGAAGQQQRSNEINLSVGLARNAEALLTRNLGRLAGEGLQNIVNDNKDGHWFPALSSRRDWSLTLDPRERGELFFLVRAQGRTLYTASRDPNAPPTTGLGDNDSTAGVFEQLFFALPDSNIHPQGLRVEMVIGRSLQGGGFALDPPITFLGPELSEEIEFIQPPVQNVILTRVGDTRPSEMSPPREEYNVSSQVAGSWANSQTGDLAGFNAFAWLHLASPPANRNDVGFLEFRIADLPSDAWIESITIDSYDWRNARLISLNDRFIFEDDARFPGGRRPVMGYTALLRTVDSGSASQLTIFTYSLSPVAIPRGNTQDRAFIPPELSENFLEGRGLLREYRNVILGYDEDRDQYYIQVDATGASVNAQRQRQVVEPGQILMMVNSEGVVLGGAGSGLDDGTTPGSDIPVRVIAQQRVDNNILRGYLDRSPRVNGRSPLRNRGTPTSINLLGFNLNPESLTSDRTEWRIRPVEARQFQLVFDN